VYVDPAPAVSPILPQSQPGRAPSPS
jgi:hypothetical protein